MLIIFIIIILILDDITHLEYKSIFYHQQK